MSQPELDKQLERIENLIAAIKEGNNKRTMARKGYRRISVEAQLTIDLIYTISPTYYGLVDGRSVDATNLKRLIQVIVDEIERTLESAQKEVKE